MKKYKIPAWVLAILGIACFVFTEFFVTFVNFPNHHEFAICFITIPLGIGCILTIAERSDKQ